MRTQRATRFTHWLGMSMTRTQTRLLKKFRMENTELICDWMEKNQNLTHIPPIYWDYETLEWKWAEVPDEKVRDYLVMCKAVAQTKRFDK